jgi:hypothetical protein
MFSTRVCGNARSDQINRHARVFVFPVPEDHGLIGPLL